MLLNKKVIVIDRLSTERAKHGNLYLDDFDPIVKFLKRPKNLDELKNLIGKKEKFIKSKKLLKLLKDEVNYPNHTSSLDKVSKVIINDFNTRNKFSLMNYFKIKIFLIKQNFLAFKFIIKRLFGFKEVGSIFSLGFFRIRKIKNFIK